MANAPISFRQGAVGLNRHKRQLDFSDQALVVQHSLARRSQAMKAARLPASQYYTKV